MSFEIKYLNIGSISYKELDHIMNIYIDQRETVLELGIKYIQNWDPPYEYEYITKEDKIKILKRTYDWYINNGRSEYELDFDFKNDSDFKDIFKSLKTDAGIAYQTETRSVNIASSGKFWELEDFSIIYCLKCYNELSHSEQKKFYALVLKDENILEGVRIEDRCLNSPDNWNYKVSRLLKDYAKRRVEECKINPNQNAFTFGLYALNMILTEGNEKGIKEILIDYVKLSKEKGLTFEEFMKKDYPLNKTIEETKEKMRNL